jgi:hypothetical protein
MHHDGKRLDKSDSGRVDSGWNMENLVRVNTNEFRETPIS